VPRGSLEITASQPGAVASLDGRRLGDVPQTAQGLVAGAYVVRVDKEGFERFQRQVQVRADRLERVYAELEPLPPVLRIDSDVAGASVFLDRRFLGTTPLETRESAPGSHQLVVSAEGYDMHSETVEVAAPSTRITVRLDVVRLDESVDVVHKHTFGSCRGRLIATVEGLRYETSHDSHGFAVPLAAIESFEIDYLKKNLRLKLRGGRTYNFTEASGDADALLVLHTAVEKARNP
jgi:hypothetical protein